MSQQARNQLTEEEVLHIAKLAKLILTPDEVKKFQNQLSSVLEYILLLDEIDTSAVKPTAQVTNLENIFREDQTTPSFPLKAVLPGASQKHKGFFSTEPVIEE